jgi:hypothetical protein
MTAWVAEILRKNHRECAVCRLAPTHLYDPEEGDITSLEISAEPTGTPLCHSCVGARLGKDLEAFEGRCLVFEPTLGPETYLFRAVEKEGGADRVPGTSTVPGPSAASPVPPALRAALSNLPAPCADCRAPESRFRWVSADMDASLWGDDWLPALTSGELTPGPALCGRCAGARVARSLEDRGLTFEAITPARGTADGYLCAAETSPEDADSRG